MPMMRRRLDIQSSIPCDRDSFDMWRDYMNLGGLLEKLCSGVRLDNGGAAEGPREPQPAAAWSHIQSPKRRRTGARKSAETSSASSASDISSSGTCSDYCRFCKQNGESPTVYGSHRLKTDDGKITCPILRSYTCPICEATGDYAHTRRYCPQAQRQEAARKAPLSKFW